MHEDESAAIRHLSNHKDVIVARWTELTFRQWSDTVKRVEECDRFRDPAGHIVRHNLGMLFDALLQNAGAPDIAAGLVEVVRLEVVQRRTDAVSFVSLLKGIVIQELESCEPANPAGLAAVMTRVDELQSMESELRRQCRGHIRAIQIREERRRNWVSERIALKSAVKGLS